jgi:predicted nucleic acid-binding protein
VAEAISDTGPILHLHEVGRLDSLRVFTRLIVPNLVADELRSYGLDCPRLAAQGVNIARVSVRETHRAQVETANREVTLQPADLEVFTLAYEDGFQKPVLTDDLRLRQYLEAHGAVVTGTVGVLVRAYQSVHSSPALIWRGLSTRSSASVHCT